MKLFIQIACIWFFMNFVASAKSQPVSNFFKLKWEFQTDDADIIELARGFIFTSSNQVVDAISGEEVTVQLDTSISDGSLLVHDSEMKLEVMDLRTDNYLTNKYRKRARYFENEQIKLITDSIWVEVNPNMKIEGFNVYTQKQIWSTPSESRIADRPLIKDDKVYVVNRNQIIVLDKYNGNVLNTFSIGGQLLSKLTFYEDFLYMIVRNVGLVAINLNSNNVAWTYNLDRYSGHTSKIIIDGENIYFSDGNLNAITRNSGDLKWKLGSEEGVFVNRPDYITGVEDCIIFYSLQDNDPVLTIADKNNGNILFQDFNSNIVGGDKNNPDGVAKEDLLLINFRGELVENNILVGTMDNKIYGFELLR
ncbi:hypothetical protein C900_02315 [Fulvivirga imtechensis AK7]|uniref:Pyrrolo-quinoline quinone repeat domain-containing protein n=1 Tax=Fulvivirga imtechensis AK7 TaxID=1237149 RepID=L8JSA3_9BACT|nr:PQQ-binding-like beta-propeller repeat protein [Fulvivirga imtechensis]ELR71730.1 hypothetical protein C900_02315 [Fulvivirga imtechensis AK7]